MRQTTISTNGHGTTVPDEDLTAPERRNTTARGLITPEALIERQIQSAHRQLADARETLKESRKRVVQLEEVIASWERFAAELRRGPRTAD